MKEVNFLSLATGLLAANFRYRIITFNSSNNNVFIRDSAANHAWTIGFNNFRFWAHVFTSCLAANWSNSVFWRHFSTVTGSKDFRHDSIGGATRAIGR